VAVAEELILLQAALADQVVAVDGTARLVAPARRIKVMQVAQVVLDRRVVVVVVLDPQDLTQADLEARAVMECHHLLLDLP
jgi:hypothetical protein